MRPAFQSVNQGGHELINLEKNKQQSIILETLDRVNKNWQALAIKLLNTSAKFDELQEQSEKFYVVYKHVTLWLDSMEVKLVSIPPVGLDPDVLSSQMKEQKVLVFFFASKDILTGSFCFNDGTKILKKESLQKTFVLVLSRYAS